MAAEAAIRLTKDARAMILDVDAAVAAAVLVDAEAAASADTAAVATANGGAAALPVEAAAAVETTDVAAAAAEVVVPLLMSQEIHLLNVEKFLLGEPKMVEDRWGKLYWTDQNLLRVAWPGQGFQ